MSDRDKKWEQKQSMRAASMEQKEKKESLNVVCSYPYRSLLLFVDIVFLVEVRWN